MHNPAVGVGSHDDILKVFGVVALVFGFDVDVLLAGFYTTPEGFQVALADGILHLVERQIIATQVVLPHPHLYLFARDPSHHHLRQAVV